jgi:hypothetical protein
MCTLLAPSINPVDILTDNVVKNVYNIVAVHLLAFPQSNLSVDFSFTLPLSNKALC